MATINLTLANDTFTYGVADSLNLIVNGRGGNDTITTTANSGTNTVNTLAGNDTVTTGAGNDTFNAGNGNNTINAGLGNNRVRTGAAGGGTADVSGDTAGTGDDTITTLGGNDTVDAGNGNNTVSTGAGVDLVTTGAGNDMITTDVGNDTVTAGAGDDTVSGGADSDVLSGEDGNDILSGEAGSDTLSGGSGVDTLTGGSGNDTLIYQSADGSVQGGVGTDNLRIDGRGMTLDLTLISDLVFVDIETINLRTSGDNTLTLAHTDVLALSTTTDTLKVYGSSGDVVNAGSGWVHGADQVFGTTTFDSYTRGGATLLVDSDITQNIFA
jgi:Ca2+-binding RTX toxin-like protein